MKTVVISRNDKELVRVPLNRKSLLAGRSPSCDAVVRYKGVKPVQFMIEHVSENLSEGPAKEDFEQGFWTLLDISDSHINEADKRSSSSGAGIVLDENLQNFNGFDFKIVIDTLLQTDLKKGVLSRSLDSEQVAVGDDRSVVEIVYFRKDIDIVTNISHLSRHKTSKKIKLFSQLPRFIFEWENDKDIKASIKTDDVTEKFEIFKRGERITADFIESKKLDIHDDDVIHIETENNDFYIRLVPAVEVVLEKFSWFNDYIIRATLVVLCLLFTSVFMITHFTTVEEIVPELPRVIKIEVPAPKQNEPAEQAPEEVVAVKDATTAPVTPEKEKPIQKTADMALQKEVKPVVKAAAASTAVVNRPKDKAQLGLNNNSKPKDVNTIGLLAKLKNGAQASKQKVSADTILNQGVVSETMTGDSGKVVVNKAPVGTIGKSNQAINPNALAEASTTLSGATTADPKSSGSLALAGGTGKFSTGTELNGLKGVGSGGSGSNSGSSGAATSGSGLGRDDTMQAVGGLDKDAIRKALRENRRAIANCYETALLTKKQLDGRMTFRWVISIEGNVSSIQLQNSELKMPNFESCVESVIKSISFPQAPNKMTTTVIYPFAFQGKK